MVEIRRGDVVLCDLNPVRGTEQAGIRPVIVLQIDRANLASPHTIIAPCSTRIRKVLLPSHAFLPAGSGGLMDDSVVLCEQLSVVDKARIVKVLGQLESSEIKSIEAALSIILGLQSTL